jgi:hypothetical protein
VADAADAADAAEVACEIWPNAGWAIENARAAIRTKSEP